jgi:hypothetical protein
VTVGAAGAAATWGADGALTEGAGPAGAGRPPASVDGARATSTSSRLGPEGGALETTLGRAAMTPGGGDERNTPRPSVEPGEPPARGLGTPSRGVVEPEPSGPRAGAAATEAGASSGWCSRLRPSRSALRRTRSAWASSMLEEWLVTPMPIARQSSRPSLLVRPSSFASSYTRIFLAKLSFSPLSRTRAPARRALPVALHRSPRHF